MNEGLKNMYHYMESIANHVARAARNMQNLHFHQTQKQLISSLLISE